MSRATLYSAEEVAALLGLHVRTVRGYVRSGRLPAVRIGKQYRIAAEDLAELTGGRAVDVAAEAPGRATVQAEASSIVQIDGLDERSTSRLNAFVTGAIAGRPAAAEPLHVQTVHDRQRSSVKVVVIGAPEDTAILLSLISTFLKEMK